MWSIWGCFLEEFFFYDSKQFLFLAHGVVTSIILNKVVIICTLVTNCREGLTVVVPHWTAGKSKLGDTCRGLNTLLMRSKCSLISVSSATVVRLSLPILSLSVCAPTHPPAFPPVICLPASSSVCLTVISHLCLAYREILGFLLAGLVGGGVAAAAGIVALKSPSGPLFTGHFPLAFLVGSKPGPYGPSCTFWAQAHSLLSSITTPSCVSETCWPFTGPGLSPSLAPLLSSGLGGWGPSVRDGPAHSAGSSRAARPWAWPQGGAGLAGF